MMSYRNNQLKWIARCRDGELVTIAVIHTYKLYQWFAFISREGDESGPRAKRYIALSDLTEKDIGEIYKDYERYLPPQRLHAAMRRIVPDHHAPSYRRKP